ncbi:glutathione S-transferase 1-1-like [Acyrthosiphon pisum]|uniref:GST C-terminal domain-containing protein n=1 Tax=Acyrthosiphon pisum TaxID=7029 RepID=A0A8R2B8R1_ACYPI|nr:glutathione S-transferase 1-1-like [Acyrthosiphon pisum]|eukprot:XP_008186550.1 PREDICTED: glutathione S-transferase 1-1-like [Acyrthosiphon pisum]
MRCDGGKDDHSLYPDDPKIQAQVNQRLHFDNGTLYLAYKRQYIPWIYNRIAKTEDREKNIHEALEFLENVLKKSPWTAGDSMTVADFALVASISTFQVSGVDLNSYNNINKWLIKCANTMNGYKTANQMGVDLTISLLNNLEEFDDLNQTHSL